MRGVIAREETIKRLLFFGGSIFAYKIFGPAINGPDIDPAGGAALLMTFLTGNSLIECGAAHFLNAARLRKAHAPSKQKGGAKVIKTRKGLGDAVNSKTGLYVGAFNGNAIFADMQKALGIVIGPNSSGKDMRFQIPMMATCGVSFVAPDLASESAPMLSEFLKKKGYAVYVVDLAEEFPDRIKSASLNPHDLYANALTRPNGVADITAEGAEDYAQLLTEPPGGAKEPFWIKAARRTGRTISISEALRKLHEASYTDVKELIADRKTLRDVMAYQAGTLEIENNNGEPELACFPYDEAPFRKYHSLAKWEGFVSDHKANCQEVVEIIDDADGNSKSTFWQSFSLELSNALAPYGRNTNVFEKTSSSSFDLGRITQEPTAVLITASQRRSEAQYPVVGQLIAQAMRAVINNPGRTTYFFISETNLVKIPGLLKFVQGARKYGARVILLPQNIPGLDLLYGKTTREALWNETEFVIALPGTKDEKTLSLFETMSGEESWIEKSQSLNLGDGAGVQSETITESTRPAMSKKKIRQLENGTALLWQRNKDVAIVDAPFVAETNLKDKIGTNPHYGDKPWRLPTKLRFPSWVFKPLRRKEP